MDKNKNRENDIEIITELNESNDSNKIEDTIQDMLNKVMEEKEPLNNSFNFYDDEDDSFKISRHSTRHQTTVKSIGNNSKNPNSMAQFFIPNFNRGNKRNLTQASPSFRNYYNSNFPFMTNNPFFYSNNGNNNFIPNYYNNNFAFNNNNLNQSFQSYHSFNPQYSNNYQNNFIRNTMPYSKTVSYHNQGNILNLGNNNFQPNFFSYGNNNNNNNMKLIFNRNNKSGFFPMNSDMEFKRGENRKKTYDTQNNLISNCLNNNNINNNLCFNKQFEDQLFNNSFINNNNNIYINNTNDNNNIKNNNIYLIIAIIILI